jgi:polar amino acid transport system ATP-binding protein
VGKTFDAAPVLTDVTFDVPRGQVIALIGPSGSGKSTLLRCINHLEEVTVGRLLVDGEFVGYREKAGILVPESDRVIAAKRSQIGMVFQSFNLFPHMTALSNVMSGPLRVRKTPPEEARRQALELLDRVGLSDKAKSYPLQLSGGQQQRVAIARALAMKPKLMLFDEPTSALDPEMIDEVLAVIRGLAHTGMTLMIATHEMAFARDVSDRVMFLDGGKLVEDGPPTRVFTHPDSSRCAEFLRKTLAPNVGASELGGHPLNS